MTQVASPTDVTPPRSSIHWHPLAHYSTLPGGSIPIQILFWTRDPVFETKAIPGSPTAYSCTSQHLSQRRLPSPNHHESVILTHFIFQVASSFHAINPLPPIPAAPPFSHFDRFTRLSGHIISPGTTHDPIG